MQKPWSRRTQENAFYSVNDRFGGTGDRARAGFPRPSRDFTPGMNQGSRDRDRRYDPGLKRRSIRKCLKVREGSAGVMRRCPTPRLVVYPPEPSHTGRGVRVSVMCQPGWAMVPSRVVEHQP